ncbi:MAG TPA: type III PLP-dependent enzyme [Afifellaceae bacterium]|nr:type III PLP-dependent enzyme [Afifellaceae bacterium]
MKAYDSAVDLVRDLQPTRPVLGIRPHAATRAASWFLANFPGRVLYAVKANDNPLIADALSQAGVSCFDVASLGEIEQYAGRPGAELYLMHPVKSRDLIARAYHEFGVRHFSFDLERELAKICEETGRARDLHLYLRLAVPNSSSVIPLDRKFGAEPKDAVPLLRLAREVAAGLGISFHVGSQSLEPQSYARALEIAAEVIAEAGVPVDYINVGGGFPARHPGSEPPHLSEFFHDIQSSLARLGLDRCTLLAEPGRALVAESESLIVKVLGRRARYLYINDGTYGCMFEGAQIYGGLAYPVRRIRDGQELEGGRLEPFALWGPSCDSIDFLPGPFLLPADTDEGDYLEIGQLGAYGRVSLTRFNGYGRYDEAILADDPMMSMYGGDAVTIGAAATA